MKITRVNILTAVQRMSQLGYSLAYRNDLLFVGAPNAMQVDRPSGRVVVWKLDPLQIVGYSYGSAQTGRPSIGGWQVFSYSDRYAHSLAACDLGMIAGIPRFDGSSVGVFGADHGRIEWVTGYNNTETFLPSLEVGLPQGARLGEALDAHGSLIIAGAPGIQMAIIYQLDDNAIHVLRPEAFEPGFGEFVAIHQGHLAAVSSDKGLHTYVYNEVDWQEAGFFPALLQSTPVQIRDEAIYALLNGRLATLKFPTDIASAHTPDAWINFKVGDRYEVARRRLSVLNDSEVNTEIAVYDQEAGEMATVPCQSQMHGHSLLWIDENTFAAGDCMHMGGVGCAHIYKVTR